LEKRGKKTPLSDLPEITGSDAYYLDIIGKLRRMTSPISIQDIAAYCSLFKVVDVERLYEIVAKVNLEERRNG